MYKGVGVRFADFILFFLNTPNLTETKLFHFHRKFNNGGGGGGGEEFERSTQIPCA